MPEVDDEAPVIVDYKTGKDVYEDYGVQGAGYAKSDFIAQGDEEMYWGEPFPRPRAVVVVILRPDGTYKAVPFTDLDERFEVFKAAQILYAHRNYKMEPALEGSVG